MDPQVASPDRSAEVGTRRGGPVPPTVLARALPLTGAAFVVAVLAGNSMAETVAVTDETPAGTASALAAGVSSGTVGAGLVLEALGLVCLAVFAAAITARTRGAVAGPWPLLVTVGATVLVAVKLASAAPYLAARALVGSVPDEVVHALVEVNEAAFVLTWIPMALLVGAAATALRHAGLAGPVLAGAGWLLAAAGLALGVVGLLDHATANPVPFLLSLVWVLVVAVRLALRADRVG